MAPLTHGLVDDVLVHVVPLLLGDGTLFLSAPGRVQIDLEPVDVVPGPVTSLLYRVRR